MCFKTNVLLQNKLRHCIVPGEQSGADLNWAWLANGSLWFIMKLDFQNSAKVTSFVFLYRFGTIFTSMW
jgi:hypothetical protein